MLGSLVDFLILFAQAAPAAAAGGGKAEASPLTQFLPLLPIPIIFYFMLIRPQQAQEKRRKEMITRLKKGDKIVTSSGMYGTVISVDEAADRVQLRLDDEGKVKATFTKASIFRVLGEPAEKPAESK